MIFLDITPFKKKNKTVLDVFYYLMCLTAINIIIIKCMYMTINI